MIKQINISILNMATRHRLNLLDTISAAEQAMLDASRELNRSGYECTFGWHIDVMDGKYVEQIACSPQELVTILTATTMPVEVHLMVEDIRPYIYAIKMANKPTSIIVHQNQTEYIKYADAPRFVAINPGEDITKDTFNTAGHFLVMTVKPGLGCQKFIDKATWIVDTICKDIGDCQIEFDGGVNLDTLPQCKQADSVVIGSEAMTYLNQGMQQFKNYLMEAAKTWL